MGVIRDSSGKILCTYAGPVDCVDSNRVEVYPMLMGCHELCKLKGYNAIIEGDSLSAIQWGSSQDFLGRLLTGWTRFIKFHLNWIVASITF